MSLSINNSEFYKFDYYTDDINSLKRNQNVLIINNLNSIKKINIFLIDIHNSVKNNQKLMIVFENNKQREIRIFNRFATLFSLFDFIIIRVLFKKIVLLVSNYRPLSVAEVLGRLVYNNFDIDQFYEKENKTHVIFSKTIKPIIYPSPNTSIIIGLKRYKKNLEIFKMYKLRTMHIYSEFLQDYIVENYGYTFKGKPNNDFRVTFWGKFLRKFWIDELPQLFNVLKGDLKFFGIRPLSKSYLKKVPKDFLSFRSQFKPGCIPPYVSLLKQSDKEYFEAEKIYLNEYHNSRFPFFVDVKYIYFALKNIILGRILSE